MTRRREHWTLWFLYVCMAAPLLASCLSRPPVATSSVSDKLVSGYDLTNKIPLKVELYRSELRAGESQRKGPPQSYKVLYGGTAAYYLGEALARNAENVARAVFSAVVATGGNGGQGPGMTGCAAVLIPRIVTIEQSLPAFGASTLTVLLEWTLQDERGNLIWVDTLTGEGEREISHWGWKRASDIEQLHHAMLNDLFHKSFSALSSSRAIQDFAAKHAHPPPNHP